MKILVTGHTGFVGKNFLKQFKHDNRFELILMSRSNGFDLTNNKNLKDIECDIIINLSGLVSIEDGWSDPYSMFKDNYLITLNLLELSRNNKASFIHISSYVYGVPQYLPINEKHPISGYNPYASSKALIDLLSLDYAKHFNFPVTILRPFNLYGEGQKSSFLIAGLLDTIITKNSLDIKDLNARRDYLWIGDFIAAIEKVIFNQREGSHVYNVGYGKSYSAQEVIDTIENSSGKSVIFHQSDPEKILVQDCYCDNSLFSQTFNWIPKKSLREGVSKMIEGLNF